MIRAVLPGMQARKFGRIINITSAMVKSPRPHMGLSTAARAALTAFSKSQSFEVMADNVTINNLLPERIKTGRQEFMANRMVKADGITMDEAYKRIAATLAAKRMGTPEEFGDACAYLCSAQAGFYLGPEFAARRRVLRWGYLTMGHLKGSPLFVIAGPARQSMDPRNKSAGDDERDVEE